MDAALKIPLSDDTSLLTLKDIAKNKKNNNDLLKVVRSNKNYPGIHIKDCNRAKSKEF